MLWPYGHTLRDVPRDMTRADWQAMVALGQQMAALNGYTAAQGSDLYIVDGDQGDWEYFEHRIFSYTFEMAKGSQKRYYPTQAELALDLERNRGAVLHMLELAIKACKAQGKYVGICGQGPSDHPELAQWLLEQGIESMSLNPDTVVDTWLALSKAKGA